MDDVIKSVLPAVIKQQAFGGDWFMFYCGECGAVINMNKHKNDRLFCARCETFIDWSGYDAMIAERNK